VTSFGSIHVGDAACTGSDWSFASVMKLLNRKMCAHIHYKMQKTNQGSEKKRWLGKCERFLNGKRGDSA
jgi:hypothetical protein